MELDLTIHCYGYSKLIFHVLQALAMFRTSNFYEAVIEAMVLMVGTFYAWQMAAAGVEGKWRAYFRKCLGMIIFVIFSRNNTNSNKYNDNLEYASGESSYSTEDGARVKIAANGRK